MTVLAGADHNLGAPEAQALLAAQLRELLRAVRRVPAVRSASAVPEIRLDAVART
ncbi:hypothetical protein [Methylobacterium tardum]|uniref:hypothetical protein n=1 Tax=Methylobacterium tardum TaxID=374432 RepID=UPI0036113C10